MTGKTTFALFFGNRGFFPSSLLHSAREDMVNVLGKLGHKTLLLEESATPHGAVETPEQGRIFARFLEANRGKFGGVILCLPNFGDENGAAAALKSAGVPILVQAYPDEPDKMGPKSRRDAFCGKLSITDVFKQCGIPFTNLKPHTVHPTSAAFARNVEDFDRICRVVQGMREMVIGAIGARTTPFKTVRVDELALQAKGITVETVDLSDVFARMDKLDTASAEIKAKTTQLQSAANWKGVPLEALTNLARLGVVLDHLTKEFGLNAMALRCWTELQRRYGISPCVVNGELADTDIPVACEVDVANAVTMYALSRASGQASTILDWNNNYGDDENKCIIFHCGNVPKSLMKEKGAISDHLILKDTVGEGRGFGCSVGRLRPMPFTYGSMMTEKGEMNFYLGEGRITDDPVASDYFGCPGVAQIDRLQDVLQWLGRTGHRHHVSITPGHLMGPIVEAFRTYLGYGVTTLP
jgi:L-fucose isomerase-like protein